MMKQLLVLSAVVLLTLVSSTAFAEESHRGILIPSGTSTEECAKASTCYFPYKMFVERDTVITWTNLDDTAHTVTSGNIIDGPDGIFNSGRIKPGDEFSHKFTIMKPHEYYCMLHPWMTGYVDVKFDPLDEEKELVRRTAISSDGTVSVEIESTVPKEDQNLGIHAYFKNMTGNIITGINYDLEVSQGKQKPLVMKGQYSHTGIAEHWTEPLRYTEPVDVQVTILGIGDPDVPYLWTGPKGDTITFTAVPEFGPLTNIILLMATMSIILISTKMRLLRKF